MLEILDLILKMSAAAIPVFLLMVFLWNNIFKEIILKIFERTNNLYIEKFKSDNLHKNSIDLKKIEFEYVIIERGLPLIENAFTIINNYTVMLNTYHDNICKKGELKDSFENNRVELDRQIFDIIPKIELYMDKITIRLLYKIRRIVSCSFDEPKKIYYTLYESNIPSSEICSAANDLWTDLRSCFIDISKSYISLQEKESIDTILNKNNLDKDICSLRKGAIYIAAEKFLMLHEYHNTEEILKSLDFAFKESGRSFGEHCSD